MRTFSVKNFDKFQHYKDRSPPWIKLYNELLDDYDFGQLPDATKFHLVAIWLLASRTNNKIPYDAQWVSGRINATEPVDLDALVRSGFIFINQELQTVEQVASKALADCKQDAIPETERESEGEKKESRVASGPTVEEHFERFWSAYPKRPADPKKPAFEKFRSAVKSGVDPSAIIAGAVCFADECERKRTEPRYIPMAKAWLHQARWEAYAESAAAKDQTIAELENKFLLFEGDPRFKAHDDHLRATRGIGANKTDIRDPVTGRLRSGWYFDSEWPPGHDPTTQVKQAA